MARSPDLVLNLPRRLLSFTLVTLYRGCWTGKLAPIWPLVEAVVAVTAITARFASSTWKFLVAFNLEPVTPQAAKTVALAFSYNALGRGHT